MMKKHGILLGALLITWFGTSLASPPENSAAVVSHLEFLGYDVTVNEKHILAKHPKYLNILVKKYRGGMLLTSFFGGKEYGKKNIGSWQTLVNTLNREAAAARYYISKSGNLVIEGYFPGAYEKKRFGAFLTVYNLESAHIAKHGTEIKKYVK